MRAFTLLEVLIVAVIFSFLMVGITSVLNLGNITFPVDLGQINLQNQTRQAMQWMTRELLEASGVTVGSGNNRITFNNYNGSGITYYLDTSDANGDHLNNQIIREFPSGTRRMVAQDISGLVFTSDATNPLLLRIDISASRAIMNKPFTFTLTEQVRLRNE